MKAHKKRQYKRFNKRMKQSRLDKAFRNIFVKAGILDATN